MTEKRQHRSRMSKKFHGRKKSSEEKKFLEKEPNKKWNIYEPIILFEKPRPAVASTRSTGISTIKFTPFAAPYPDRNHTRKS